MSYLLFKVIHIVMAMLWVGSFFVVAYMTSTHKMPSENMRSAIRVTEFSIGITWFAGIVLVIMGSWYASSWWHIKIVLVVLLSAIHSIVHRRWKNTDPSYVSTNAAVPVLVVILAFLIVFLAVFKYPV